MAVQLVAALATAASVPLPPWVMAETIDQSLQSAGENSFAATLGSTSIVAATSWSGRRISTFADALRHTRGVLDRARSQATTAIFLPGAGRAVTLGFECKR